MVGIEYGYNFNYLTIICYGSLARQDKPSASGVLVNLAIMSDQGADDRFRCQNCCEPKQYTADDINRSRHC